MANSGDGFLAARCSGKQKRRIERLEKKTGVKESDILRAAVDYFLSSHGTPELAIKAVAQWRMENSS